MKYIKNGRFVFSDGVVCSGALAYDGKIGGMCAESEIPADAEVIDAGGLYVSPGFVDIHVHGYLGADSSDGDRESLKTIAGGLIKNGVTSFLPSTMTVPQPQIEKAFEVIRASVSESRRWAGSEILGVHAEGPYINPKRKGAQAGESIQSPDADFILKNRDIVRLVTVASEMDAGHRFIKSVSAAGITISLGHTDASYEEAMSAFRDGASHVTHLFNAMSPLNHRQPGTVGAALASDATVELIADTFHVSTALYPLLAKLKPDGVTLVTDCIRAGGLADGEYDLGGQKVTVNGIQCRLDDGTIAGSVLKLNRAVKNYRDYAGIPLYKAVKAASELPAAAVGVPSKGSLKPGCDADILLFDEDVSIKRVIKAGESVCTAE